MRETDEPPERHTRRSVRAYRSVVAFGVLGPVSAVVDGRPVSVGGPIQRRVLAALLARAPGSVTADLLVDDVWGESPPPSAVKTLHSHVNRLRTTLGRRDPWAIETVDGGYRLPLGREDLDAWMFEDLVSAANREGVTPVEASKLLHDALRLWRGAAYGEFRGSGFADAEAQRLEALREIALEDRIDADLAAGAGPGLVAELEGLVRAHPYRERLWADLVVATYRSGRQAEALDVYQRARTVLGDELGIEPGPELRAAEAAVLSQDPGLLAPTRTPRVVCPWKGLAAYESSDVDFFVGRERLVAEMVARLVDHSVLVVTGPSGSGKSSVVRAGLLPVLAGDAVLGSARWRTRVVTPAGEDPRRLGEASAEVDLLVIDQAEELFTLSPQDIAVVGAALGDRLARGMRLVLVVRGDFFGRLAELPEVVTVAGAGTVLVGAPEPDELRRMVHVPAGKVGLTVDPALEAAVVADVAGRPAALPLLSTALVRTWERCDGRRLTLSDYVAAGGTATALERLAEETYASLDDEGQQAARRILVRMAVLEDGRWVRRRVVVSGVAPPGDLTAQRALETLARRRLVTLGRDDAQLSHEALLVAWPRLSGWLDERAATSGVVEHLTTAAAAWDGDRRDPSDVYRGARLQAALDLAATHPEEIGPVESAFIDASRTEADRELREARAGRQRLQFVAAALVVLLVLALVTGGVAVRKSRDATDAARVADAQRLGLQAITRGDPTQALLMAVAAVRLDDSPSTEANLLATLQQSNAPSSSLALSAPAVQLAVSQDGWLAASLADGTDDCFSASSGDCSTFDPRPYLGGRPSGALAWRIGHQAVIVGVTTSANASRLYTVNPVSSVAALLSMPVASGSFVVTQDGRRVVAVAASSAPKLVVRSTGTDPHPHYVTLAGKPLRLAAGGGSVVVVAESGSAIQVVDLDRGTAQAPIRLPAQTSALAASSTAPWSHPPTPTARSPWCIFVTEAGHPLC